ncbi:MAG: E3 binding domain-containing protein, partial [Rubrobacter sp.]
GKSVDTTVDLDWTPTEPQPRTAAKKKTVSRSKKNDQRRASLAAQDVAVPYDVTASTEATDDEAPAAQPEPAVETPAETSSETPTETTEAKATDAAEERAGELDVDLSSIEGTGADENITVEDVEKAARSNDE